MIYEVIMSLGEGVGEHPCKHTPYRDSSANALCTRGAEETWTSERRRSGQDNLSIVGLPPRRLSGAISEGAILRRVGPPPILPWQAWAEPPSLWAYRPFRSCGKHRVGSAGGRGA